MKSENSRNYGEKVRNPLNLDTNFNKSTFEMIFLRL